MGKQRLEAFSDGVFAILITIMVLELKVPHGSDWAALAEVTPRLLTYALSFVFVGIYWNNHHHLLHTVERTTGGILWANQFLLFWISLIPFGCAWMDESQFASLPTAAYGVVLFLCGAAYSVLQATIIRSQGPDSRLKKAVGTPVKEKLSILFYLVAIAGAFLHPYIGLGFFVVVAGMWLVPDQRIERAILEE